MSLKANVLRGSLWSVAGNAGQQAANFVIFLYLARALDPAAIGLVALAAILLEIVGATARLGVVEALQREQPNPALETALLLILLGSGAVGAVLIAAFAGGAWWLGYDRTFVQIILLLSPIALFQAVNTLPEAMFRRRLDYRSLAFRNWAATIAAGAVAFVMIERGFGVFALVGQRLTLVAVSSLLLWLQIRWRPVRGFAFRQPRAVLATGWKVLVASLSGLLNTRIADMITGAFLGPAALGFLRLGWRFRDTLVQLTVQPMTGVALTSLSHLRDDPAARRRAFLRLTQLMAFVSLPIFFGLSVVAEPLLRLLVGPKWLGGVIVFQLLGPLMVAGSINYFFAPMMVAVGRADVVMRQSIAQTAATVPLIWAGSYFGLVGILAAHIARAFIVAAYNVTAVRAFADVPARATIGAVTPATVCSFVMAAGVVGLQALLPPLGDLPVLAISVGSGAALYLLLLLAGDLGGLWRNHLRDTINSIASALPRRSAGGVNR